MASQLPSIMDVTDLAEIVILVEFINMHEKCLEDLCEFTFLDDFPENADNDDQKRIIVYMLDKYVKSTCMINVHSNLLITFTFNCCMQNVHLRQVIISNNMRFRDDILMICFLQHLLYLNIPEYLACKVTIAMMFIMVNKYDITLCSLAELNKITIVHVSVSFMSVYFEILYNNFFNFSDITRAFPYFNLPPMIYAPIIITIFPTLDDPPIAILMAISLIMREIRDPHGTSNISLVELHKRIIDLYKTTISEKMKLHLCTRYNIVVLEGGEYKFAPCFAKYRQKAKDIISEKRSNDPDLKDILSVI